MSERFLPYGRQAISADDVATVVDVLASDWLTTGPIVAEFERAFARRVDSEHAIACSSGTAALHLAILALGIGEGDRVIVPSLTFVATANVIRHTGAEVIFSDVDPETGLMTDADLERALDLAGGTAAAVIPVHLNGQCVDMRGIRGLASAASTAVVEDACHAVGAEYETGVSVGGCRFSDLCCFSAHPVKSFTMGEGGIVTTNDVRISSRLERLRNHGIERDPGRMIDRDAAFDSDGSANPWYYEVHAPGFNYRASDIHCALGRSQLEKLDDFLRRRAEIANRYDELLADLGPLVRPCPRVYGGRSAWHLYPVRIEFEQIGIPRGLLMRKLRTAGIGTQVHYIPVHRQPYYVERYGELSLPGADCYYRRILSLPIYPSMSDDEISRVVSALEREVRESMAR